MITAYTIWVAVEVKPNEFAAINRSQMYTRLAREKLGLEVIPGKVYSFHNGGDGIFENQLIKAEDGSLLLKRVPTEAFKDKIVLADE